MAQQIAHEDYKELTGGVMPFNWDEGPHDGIKCQKCDEISPEDAYEWVDTNVWQEETDTGAIEYDVQTIWVKCPECGVKWPAHM